MSRFKTEWLTSEANFTASADLSRAWIDQVHARRPQAMIVLDLDSSVSEEQGNPFRQSQYLVLRCHPGSDDTAEAAANFRRLMIACLADLKLSLCLLSLNKNSRKSRPYPLQVSAIERITR
jgi:hypothetical protein